MYYVLVSSLRNYRTRDTLQDLWVTFLRRYVESSTGLAPVLGGHLHRDYQGEEEGDSLPNRR